MQQLAAQGAASRQPPRSRSRQIIPRYLLRCRDLSLHLRAETLYLQRQGDGLVQDAGIGLHAAQALGSSGSQSGRPSSGGPACCQSCGSCFATCRTGRSSSCKHFPKAEVQLVLELADEAVCTLVICVQKVCNGARRNDDWRRLCSCACSVRARKCPLQTAMLTAPRFQVEHQVNGSELQRKLPCPCHKVSTHLPQQRQPPARRPPRRQRLRSHGHLPAGSPGPWPC